MRIGIYIDGQFKKMTGIQHCTDSLIEGLFSVTSPHQLSAFVSSLPSPGVIEETARQQAGTFRWRDPELKRFDLGSTVRDIVPPKFREAHPWFSMQIDHRVGRRLPPDKRSDVRRVQRYDLFHIPEPHDLGFLRYQPRRAVATLYDMSTYVCRWAFDPPTIGVWDQYHDYARNRCARVIAISESTKADIIQYLKIPADRIDVTPLAARVSAVPLAPGPERDALLAPWDLAGAPFILYAGTLEPRKNLERLIKAYARMVHEDPTIEHKLVLAGGHWFQLNLELRLLACECGVGGRVLTTGYVSNEQLNALMSASDAFIYISQYEGFGMPPLEAMTCGAPVITSNVSSLPEVVGDAGIQVDPTNIGEIAAAMHRLVTDRDENRRRRALSLQRAKTFSWEKTARETLRVYEAAMADG